MFSSLPGLGAILAILSTLALGIGTALAIVLKLCGILLLSWWWVLSPLPLTVLLVCAFAGAISILNK